MELLTSDATVALALVVACFALVLSAASLWISLRIRRQGCRTADVARRPLFASIPERTPLPPPLSLEMGLLRSPTLGSKRVRSSTSAMSLVAGTSFFSFVEEPASEDVSPSRKLSAHFEQFHGFPTDSSLALDFNESASCSRIVVEGEEEDPALQGIAASLSGSWECVATWGLDDFLKRMGARWPDRALAGRAPWPSWEFSFRGKEVTYVNRSSFGVMTEVFVLGGPEYMHKDLRGNRTTCRAYLQSGALVIERSGSHLPHGVHKEVRFVNGDGELEFSLGVETLGNDCSWGRKFIKKS
eukprot:TRINITY_DN87_c0_g1_i1.p1 TRINITY_DN87_c0_g1~~TRINITY_DN87_c0_g1_i1.p1  ORF type:complete len:299 (-),score=42.34 TRINITY_DN87_c0_g1_i1:163-1059(-)